MLTNCQFSSFSEVNKPKRTMFKGENIKHGPALKINHIDRLLEILTLLAGKPL